MARGGWGNPSTGTVKGASKLISVAATGGGGGQGGIVNSLEGVRG